VRHWSRQTICQSISQCSSSYRQITNPLVNIQVHIDKLPTEVPYFIFFQKNFDFIKFLQPKTKRLVSSWSVFLEEVPYFIFFQKNFDFIKFLQPKTKRLVSSWSIFLEEVPYFIFFQKNFDFIKFLQPKTKRLVSSWSIFLEEVPYFIFFQKNFDFIKFLQPKTKLFVKLFLLGSILLIFFFKKFRFYKSFENNQPLNNKEWWS